MNKKVTSLTAIVGMAAVALLAWWWQTAPERQAAATPGPTAGAKAEGGKGGTGGARGGPGGPVAVEVGEVRRQRLVDDTEAVGTVQARQRVTLRPEISGRVARIAFKDGQVVKTGQLMVQLDDTLQQAQRQQADAQLGIARTQLQRNRELVAQSFVSQSAVDQSVAAVDVAAAQVALVQAQLARTRIVAPFGGVTGIRSIDVGDYVKDGAAMVDLEDNAAVYVDYRLPERFLAQVRVGQVVDVRIDAFAGQRFDGRIAALDAQVDAEGRSLRVRAQLDNPKGQLKSGMFARVRTVLGVREQALMVPEEALVPEGGKQYLIKVVDGPKGPVSQRLEARLGKRIEGKVEVLEGLTEADRVVTAGQERLMRGQSMPLRIVQIGGAGPKAKPAAAPASAASAAMPVRAPA